jgi:hypothetical protein
MPPQQLLTLDSAGSCGDSIPKISDGRQGETISPFQNWSNDSWKRSTYSTADLTSYSMVSFLSLSVASQLIIVVGPTPASKHDTVIQRYAGPLRSSLLFYRTSPQSRSHKSFLAHQPILPPFVVQAFIDALKSHGLLDGVQIFHLPEGEADAYCVALADELEGFVVGNDSDFAILGAKAGESNSGYRGYIPIEMMQWQLQVATATLPLENAQAGAAQGAEIGDGFQPVKSRKSKSTASKVTERNQTTTTTTSLHLLPPVLPTSETISAASTTCTLSLFLTIFTPAALATRLRIPPAYLPLFATILGTDHSPTLAQGRSYFFEDSLAKRDRVEVVARVIREALAPGNQPRMRKRLGVMMGAKSSTSGRDTPISPLTSVAMNAGDEAFSFVALVLGNLLVRPLANEDLFMELVTSMIEATCHFILPSAPSALGLYSDEALAQTGRTNLGSCCALFPFCNCSPDIAPLSESLPDFAPLHDSGEQQRVRRRFALARNSGNLTSFASFAQPDRVYLKSYLQDPEGICLSGLDGSKRVRAEAWRIFLANIHLFPVSVTDGLSDALPQGEAIDGLDSTEAFSADVNSIKVEGDDDVSEMSEDTEEFVLSAKRHHQEQVKLHEDGDGHSIGDSDDSGIWITEYYRIGASQNLGPHDNMLFGHGLPVDRDSLVLSSDPKIRHKRLLAILDADNASVHALEPTWQLLVATLRHAVRLQQQSGNGNRKAWTAVEIDRIVEAAMRSTVSWDQIDTPEDDVPSKSTVPVLLHNRNVDIVAHVTAAGIDVLALSQALLLPGDATHGASLHRLMEGSIWHEALEGHSGNLQFSPEQRSTKSEIVQAVIEGFDNTYILGATESNKPKRERTASPVPEAPPKAKAKKAPAKPPKAGHGRYDLLMDI